VGGFLQVEADEKPFAWFASIEWFERIKKWSVTSQYEGVPGKNWLRIHLRTAISSEGESIWGSYKIFSDILRTLAMAFLR
jgi:hypothetical protein